MVSHRRRYLFAALLPLLPKWVQAQGTKKRWRIGVLAAGTRPASIDGDRLGGFVRGMRQLGYVEGENLEIEWRFAGNDPGKLSQYAEELAALKVDAILTAGVPPTAAAKRATTSIPIVMGTATDPVGSGLVASLAQPGANITGLSNVSVDIGPKHLQLLLEILPTMDRVGVLTDIGTSSHSAILRSIQAAGRTSNVLVTTTSVEWPNEIESALDSLVRDRSAALIIPLSPLFNQETSRIARLALQRRLPSVSGFNEYAAAGGLMSYGQNLTLHYFHAASYIDRIFKGAKPGDLPIEQPTTFEMSVNRATARSIGVAIPATLLIRADAVVG